MKKITSSTHSDLKNTGYKEILKEDIKASVTETVKEYLNMHKKDINMGLISDGYHTFDELYYHRMILFAVICNSNAGMAWKSWKHYDGTMYDDYFIIGITTKEGDYSYHYHKDYWGTFKVKEIPNAPEWDGHKPEDIDRLMSLIK